MSDLNECTCEGWKKYWPAIVACNAHEAVVGRSGRFTHCPWCGADRRAGPPAGGREPLRFPGIVDHDREMIVGQIIREMCDDSPAEYNPGKFFRLKCSVGELAQRIVLALVDLAPARCPNNCGIEHYPAHPCPGGAPSIAPAREPGT